MLDQYFVKPSTIDRIRACWLAPQIERYVEWMRAEGYANRNVFNRVPLLCHFADFREAAWRHRLDWCCFESGGVCRLLGSPTCHELEDPGGSS